MFGFGFAYGIGCCFAVYCDLLCCCRSILLFCLDLIVGYVYLCFVLYVLDVLCVCIVFRVLFVVFVSLVVGFVCLLILVVNLGFG